MRPILDRGLAVVVSLAFAGATIVGCSNSVTDTLLKADDPDIIDPNNVQSTEGANAVRVGTIGRLRTATSSSESTWLFGGLLADEWSTSSTFVQNDETDQRKIAENNGSIRDQYRALNRVRTSANQAIPLLKKWRPTPQADIAEMYLARGFAEMQLAQDFCNGIPLSDASGDSLVYGEPLTVDEVFTAAVASFDTAMTLANGTDATSISVNRAARVGKARALVGQNKLAEAALLVPVSVVPSTYTYDLTFSTTSGVGDNILWNQPSSQRRYTVGDSLEGNAHNLLVKNAIPFFRARDPRLPVSYTTSGSGGKDTTKSQDGFTFSRTTTLYARTTPVALLNGIDARLVEAEAALRAGNAAGMMTILNALRSAPPKIGEIQVSTTALAPVTDPGTADGRINLLFREKAFWTFSRGQRLNDLRRLVRQYTRTADNVFPVGTHYRGGTYGTDVNLPVGTDELTNPKFKGCIDRKA